MLSVVSLACMAILPCLLCHWLVWQYKYVCCVIGLSGNINMSVVSLGLSGSINMSVMPLACLAI